MVRWFFAVLMFVPANRDMRYSFCGAKGSLCRPLLREIGTCVPLRACGKIIVSSGKIAVCISERKRCKGQ